MRPKNTKDLFEALSRVIDKADRGVISKDNATATIEAAKVMTSLLNYELKKFKTMHDVGQKGVELYDLTIQEDD